MGTKSPGGPQRCRLILQRCLAIQLSKPGHTPEDFWMYDSGYMIFQVSFVKTNQMCCTQNNDKERTGFLDTTGCKFTVHCPQSTVSLFRRRFSAPKCVRMFVSCEMEEGEGLSATLEIKSDSQ